MMTVTEVKAAIKAAEQWPAGCRYEWEIHQEGGILL
jgi:hypothetical protein